MIDLVLMERLVRSLRDDGRLVLLGDDRQLPSVEAGAVLRDLIAGEDDDGPSLLGPGAVRLTESHRMRADDPDGRNILTVSRTIDRGGSPRFVTQRDADDAVVGAHVSTKFCSAVWSSSRRTKAATSSTASSTAGTPRWFAPCPASTTCSATRSSAAATDSTTATGSGSTGCSRTSTGHASCV